MEPSALYDTTVAERRRLAALLTDLTPEQWGADSLCRGWRIREVVAHLNTSEKQTERAALHPPEAGVSEAGARGGPPAEGRVDRG